MIPISQLPGNCAAPIYRSCSNKQFSDVYGRLARCELGSHEDLIFSDQKTRLPSLRDSLIAWKRVPNCGARQKKGTRRVQTRLVHLPFDLLLSSGQIAGQQKGTLKLRQSTLLSLPSQSSYSMRSATFTLLALLPLALAQNLPAWWVKHRSLLTYWLKLARSVLNCITIASVSSSCDDLVRCHVVLIVGR
jgi:hypothetical protein